MISFQSKESGQSISHCIQKKEDDSYEAIKWITIAYMPIVPLYQERIKFLNRNTKKIIPFALSLEKDKYEINERTLVNRSLIKKTYLFIYGLIMPLIFTPIPLFKTFRAEILDYFNGPKFWLSCLFILLGEYQ